MLGDDVNGSKGESKPTWRSACEEFNVKIYSIVTVKDIIEAMKNGVIANTEYLEAMLQYRATYGGE